jgi:prepilin-type N-terminal cleavage/methylation domain-containing protein
LITPLSLFTPRRAFSLIELVIVVVIIGIIAAIAIPRVGSAAQNSQTSSIIGSLKVMSTAVEIYVTEHDGLSPAQNADGSADASEANFAQRLFDKSTATGVITGTDRAFGPYLRVIPKNSLNQLDTVRIDGAAAGAGTHGWRYDTIARMFQADDSASSAAMQPDGAPGP